MDNLNTLKQWISQSNRIVFFGGAGVSTESGIKDFRSVDGLYNQKFDYPPETIISHSFFVRNPDGSAQTVRGSPPACPQAASGKDGLRFRPGSPVHNTST